MGRRQKLWAARARAELYLRLGGRCEHCGSTDSLEFDCIVRRGHEHHRMSADVRMSFYRREALLGNLQLLCRECHRRKTSVELCV